jgi:hypothetical protein
MQCDPNLKWNAEFSLTGLSDWHTRSPADWFVADAAGVLNPAVA